MEGREGRSVREGGSVERKKEEVCQTKEEGERSVRSEGGRGEGGLSEGGQYSTVS